MNGFVVSLSGLPFDDIRDLVDQLPAPDERTANQTRIRTEQLADKFGDLGNQAEILQWLAAYSGKSPVVLRPMIALFAGTHKVANRIENDPTETTLETVTRLAAGGGPVNQVCATHDIGLKVFDLALQYPVEDISLEEALDEKAAAATFGFGMEAIAGGVDVLGLSAFGKGSEVTNRALLALLTGNEAEEDDMAGLIKSVCKTHHNAETNALELLRRLGGREHWALAGAILAARINHVPVVLDGWTAAVVVLLLQKLKADSCDHCFFASARSRDDTYEAASQSTGLASILEGFGTSEDGANAAQAIGLLKSMAAIHADTVLEA